MYRKRCSWRQVKFAFATRGPPAVTHSAMPMPINPLARAGGVDYPAAHVTRHRSCEAWCDSESCMHAGCFDCG